MNKYHNVKTQIDGYTFDSKAEAARYCELKLMQKAGQISGLQIHPVFGIPVNDVEVCTYKGDFSYYDGTGATIVEDVKGVRTALYRLKKKLLKATRAIEVIEVPVRKERRARRHK